MQAIHLNWSMSRLVRLFVTAFVCAMLVFSYAFPAFAAGSDPSKGEERLTEIEKKAQETVQEKPLSLEETERETNPGVDEVQGTADKNKMYGEGKASKPSGGLQEKFQGALGKVRGQRS